MAGPGDRPPLVPRGHCCGAPCCPARRRGTTAGEDRSDRRSVALLGPGGARRLAELAMTYKLPTMFGPREHAEAGGLLSYGPDREDLYRRAAAYVDKILKGAKPGDLPVQQATKFELVINLKTAKALGLTIPPSLLGRADEVIQ